MLAYTLYVKRQRLDDDAPARVDLWKIAETETIVHC